MLALRDLQTLFFLLSSLLQLQPDDCIHCLAVLNEGFQPCSVCACLHACVRACVCTLKPTPVCTVAISTPGISTCVFDHFLLSLSATAVPPQNPFCAWLFFFFFFLFSKTDPHLGAMKSPHYAWKCERGEDEGSVSGPLASFLKPP